jgi:DNA polymerase III delta prime subunit
MGLLSGIIGNKRAVEVLTRMMNNDSLPHALLFVGQDHIGKTTVAHELIRKVLCHKGALASHPDYIELKREVDEKTGKRKANISVKQVREVVSMLSMTSMSGGCKVVFIEEAHRLSISGVSALLKTLEEPRGKMLFILRTPSVDSVPATVASRCQTIRFSIVSKEEMVDGLLRTGIGKVDAQEASSHAMGRPGLAKRFIKDSDYRARVETSEAKAKEFFQSNIARRLAMVMELIPKGELDAAGELKKIVSEWQGVCRDALLDRLGCESLVMKRGTLARLSAQEILERLERISQVRNAIAHNINPHLALEHIAL